MTYYDQENQFLRQRLQKEIPILTALIQNLYQELDRKFHLNGAKIPVTFGFETDSLGSSFCGSVAEDKLHRIPFGYFVIRRNRRKSGIDRRTGKGGVAA